MTSFKRKIKKLSEFEVKIDKLRQFEKTIVDDMD